MSGIEGERAFLLAGAGRLEEAEALADAAMLAQDGIGRAWHARAIVAAKRGRLEAALAALDEAEAADEDTPDLWRARGWILKRLDRTADAEAALVAGLARHPGDGELALALGVLHHGEGRLDAAIAAYRAARVARPDRIDVACNLGMAMVADGQAQAAVALLEPLAEGVALPAVARILAAALHELAEDEAALDLLARAADEAPTVPALAHDRAVLLIAGGRPAEAEIAARRALDLGGQDPDAAQWWVTLGNALKDQGRLDEAADAYLTATQIDPALVIAQFNLGTARLEQGQPAAAEAALLHAVGRAPDLAVIHNNLGRARRDQGRFADAEAAYREAMARDPDDPEPAYNLALLLLLTGRAEEAWPHYERRWELSAVPTRDLGLPRWDGRPDPATALLLWAEQGFGDTLQCLRWLPAVAARVGRLVVEVQGPLLRLARANAPRGVRVVARGEDPGPVTAQIPTMGLPALLDEAPVPYLVAQPAPLPRGTGGPRVGLVWAGSAENRDGLHRAIDPAALAPLLAVAGVAWFALQTGPQASALTTAPLAGRGVIDLAAGFGDFADTAATLAALDALVTVDTASAHLAGALGRPTIVLLPFVPDWRWGVAGEATPFYPSVRLARQRAPGDWPSAVAEARRLLLDLIWRG
jgi:tetratricopeptide (TPR) repeat protein